MCLGCGWVVCETLLLSSGMARIDFFRKSGANSNDHYEGNMHITNNIKG